MLMDELRDLKNATPQEAALIRCILEHPDAVANCTARQLAEKSYTSAPTVTRLCQKLGLKGFPDFKVRFVGEYRSQEKQLYAEFDRPLVERDIPVSDVRSMAPRFFNRVVYETNARIDSARLSAVTRRVRQARFVDLYGTGINYHIAQCAAFQLQTLGIAAAAYDEGNIHMLERLTPASGHLSFLLSHTGCNVNMLKIARFLRKKELPIIAVCGTENSELSHYAAITLTLFSTRKVDRLSLLSYPVSLYYIFSLLYAALLSNDPDAVYQGSSAEFYPAGQEGQHPEK